MTVRIITADVLDGLAQLESESIHCVVTSPPYWGLRDYGTGRWEGGDADCNHAEVKWKSRYDYSLASSPIQDGSRTGTDAPRWKDSCQCGARRTDRQIGLEPTPEAYVTKMVEVFREVRRVLRKDGTLWLNLGDSYAANRGYQVSDNKHKSHDYGNSNAGKVPFGLKPKDLVGIPWRVAFALQADGWWLRQDIIWSKPNPMPESIKDRCTKAHEYLFMLTKAERYHYDAGAIAEPVTDSTVERLSQPTLSQQEGSWRVPGKTNGSMKAVGTPRNDGNRWNGNNGRGFVKRDKQAGHGVRHAGFNERYQDRGEPYYTRNKRSVWEIITQPFSEAHFATFPPALIEPCIKAGCPEGGMVLDPFGGAGTTGLVSDRLKRNAILIELNPAYAAMAEKRIKGDCPMFTEIAISCG